MSNTSITTNMKSRRKSSKSSASSGLEADKKLLRTVQRNVSQGILEDADKVVDAAESAWLDSNSSALTLSMVHEASSKADLSTTRLTTLALTHVSELLGTRLGLLASICQSTTRTQVMTRL